MVVKAFVKQGTYQDSVALMRVSRQVRACAGIKQASVMMATPQNKEVLREAHLLIETVMEATPSDMVVVVEAETEGAADAALEEVKTSLETPPAGAAKSAESTGPRCRTVAMGSSILGGANLAMVSVPGVYAAAEALKVLKTGLHVFLFSDNVSIEDEIDLKRFAHGRGLLVMGPDCGTALVNGVPLGFVNAVRRGGIGMVGASGTGMQEVMSLVHRWGRGISHAFGTGSRDLSEAVGGITMLDALDILAEDSNTRVVVLISKPPSPRVAETILARATAMSKPVVVCFLGSVPAVSGPRFFVASTLEETARLAIALETGKTPETGTTQETSFPVSPAGGGCLRGLFSGGTLAEEALLVARTRIGHVYSNLGGREILPNSSVSIENTIIDMGSDEFTVGRPHPMIDYSCRIERFRREMADPTVGVILMDVVLGLGSNPDPAKELAPAILEELTAARSAGRDVKVVLSIVGTESDPQHHDEQVAAFKSAGALVAFSNAQAARLATQLVVPGTEEAAMGGND